MLYKNVSDIRRPSQSMMDVGVQCCCLRTWTRVVHVSICIERSVCLSVCLSIYLSIFLPTYLPINPSIHPPTHPIHPSTHPIPYALSTYLQTQYAALTVSQLAKHLLTSQSPRPPAARYEARFTSQPAARRHKTSLLNCFTNTRPLINCSFQRQSIRLATGLKSALAVARPHQALQLALPHT
jgi:hypothetical protein